MTGVPKYNYPAFHDAAKRLRDAGFAVVNPAEMAGPDKLSWAGYMKQDIRFICDCDAIALLPGWQNSKGAKIELATAMGLGLDVYDAETLEKLDELKLDLVFS